MKNTENKTIYDLVYSDDYMSEYTRSMPSPDMKKDIESDIMMANNALKNTSRSLAALVNLDENMYGNGSYNGFVEQAFVDSLQITNYFRDMLIVSGKYTEKDIVNLPISPTKEKISVSYKNNILRICIPQITPSKPIKKKDLDPVREQVKLVLEDFYDEFIDLGGKQFEEFVLLEKYIFEENNHIVRDYDHINSSHIVNQLNGLYITDDNCNNMKKRIQISRKKGNRKYTIIYITDPKTYQKYQDVLEK